MHRAILAALCLFAAPPSWAASPVADVALVLVTDVSRSIDDSEFKLEKQGYAAAFVDPKVLAAIQGGPEGQIALAYVEFSGAEQVSTVLDWAIISDAASAEAWVARLLAAPRSSYGRTAIGSGLDRAAAMLTEAGFADARAVIDVAGDGTSNAGRPVTEARDAAVELGITVNGLAIINDHPVSYTFAHVQPPGGLANWYRENVAGGPGNFVVEVHDFSAFGTAMSRKLISEIAGLPPRSPIGRGKQGGAASSNG